MRSLARRAQVVLADPLGGCCVRALQRCDQSVCATPARAALSGSPLKRCSWRTDDPRSSTPSGWCSRCAVGAALERASAPGRHGRPSALLGALIGFGVSPPAVMVTIGGDDAGCGSCSRSSPFSPGGTPRRGELRRRPGRVHHARRRDVQSDRARGLADRPRARAGHRHRRWCGGRRRCARVASRCARCRLDASFAEAPARARRQRATCYAVLDVTLQGSTTDLDVLRPPRPRATPALARMLRSPISRSSTAAGTSTERAGASVMIEALTSEPSPPDVESAVCRLLYGDFPTAAPTPRTPSKTRGVGWQSPTASNEMAATRPPRTVSRATRGRVPPDVLTPLFSRRWRDASRTTHPRICIRPSD